ncbi:MAG TPA: flagellar hook-length control protein FliK [Planctomycetaceae bacterium]|nr:flagellar hook-length control protein FliK [Planctomycetaceae bacterium]
MDALESPQLGFFPIVASTNSAPGEASTAAPVSGDFAQALAQAPGVAAVDAPVIATAAPAVVLPVVEDATSEANLDWTVVIPWVTSALPSVELPKEALPPDLATNFPPVDMTATESSPPDTIPPPAVFSTVITQSLSTPPRTRDSLPTPNVSQNAAMEEETTPSPLTSPLSSTLMVALAPTMPVAQASQTGVVEDTATATVPASTGESDPVNVASTVTMVPAFVMQTLPTALSVAGPVPQLNPAASKPAAAITQPRPISANANTESVGPPVTSEASKATQTVAPNVTPVVPSHRSARRAQSEQHLSVTEITPAAPVVSQRPIGAHSAQNLAAPAVASASIPTTVSVARPVTGAPHQSQPTHEAQALPPITGQSVPTHSPAHALNRVVPAPVPQSDVAANPPALVVSPFEIEPPPSVPFVTVANVEPERAASVAPHETDRSVEPETGSPNAVVMNPFNAPSMSTPPASLNEVRPSVAPAPTVTSAPMTAAVPVAVADEGIVLQENNAGRRVEGIPTQTKPVIAVPPATRADAPRSTALPSSPPVKESARITSPKMESAVQPLIDSASVTEVVAPTEESSRPEAALPPHRMESARVDAPALDFGDPVPIHHAEQLVQRLGDAIGFARDSGQELSIRVTPPQFGPIVIEVRLQDGAMTARVETHSAIAHEMITEHLPQLHESLASRGATLERIDVVPVENRLPTERLSPSERTAAERESSSNGWGSAGTSERQGADTQEQHRRRPPRPQPLPAIETPPAAAPATNGRLMELQGLNVRV